MLKNLDTYVDGFFWKRKSYYLNKQDKLATTNIFKGLISKIKQTTSKYDKRFFRLDINDFTLKYAKDPAGLKNPHYETSLRDIVEVKRNTVSMPYEDKDGVEHFKELSIFDTEYNIDRGPDNCHNVFELKTIDRNFTLYTSDNSLMEKFVLYIEKIIMLRDEIRARQKQEEEKLDRLIRKTLKR